MLSPADADDITWLQAIRENGGITIVQKEGSSVSPGVAPGIADLILSTGGNRRRAAENRAALPILPA